MKKKIVVLLAIIALISFTMTETFAVSNSDLEKAKEEKAQATEALNNVKSQNNTAKSELDSVNTQIFSIQDEIDALEAKTNELSESIVKKEAEITTKENEIKDKEELLKKRMISLYKGGGTSYLDVVFGNNNYVDMISSMEIVSEIADADTKLIEELGNEKKEIETSKSELVTQKQEVETSKKEKDEKKANLTAIQASKQAVVAKLTTEEQAKVKAVDEANKELDSIQNEIRRQAAAAAAAANKKASSNDSKIYTGGKFTWPCPSYSYISSYFGNRESPGGIGSTNHKGMDMASANGSDILAASDGIVTVAQYGYNGGFGNYMIIYHGNNLSTLYAHCSSLSVSSGQTVSAGQRIGSVGSTGKSTGAHLHFGVICNGSYVNPASYLGM